MKISPALICDDCGVQKVFKPDGSFVLNDADTAATLEELIKNSFVGETSENKCPACLKNMNFGSTVEELPAMLVIRILRQPGTRILVKIESEDVKIGTQIFKLKSIGHHVGVDNGGHYFGK